IREAQAFQISLRCIRSARTPSFLLQCGALDPIGTDAIAEAGSGRSGNRAAGRDFDGWINQIFIPVAAAGGYVAGKIVAWQRGSANVVGASDAALEHATAPSAKFMCDTAVLNFFGALMPAYAAKFDVDHAGGA